MSQLRSGWVAFISRTFGRERAEAIRSFLAAPFTQDEWGALIESAPDIAVSSAGAQLLCRRKEAVDEFESFLREHSDH